jgi:uncharacterized protein
MAVPVSYPGVYIEEFTPAPPIQGAATSVTALLGPASKGPILQPTLVTSWDQFQQVFVGPLQGFYLWYAARGFFQNGGQLLYIVRVSNAALDHTDLVDRSAPPGVPVLSALALTPGANSTAIEVTVDENAALTSLPAFSTSAPISYVDAAHSAVIVSNAADAAQFRPGDTVALEFAGPPATYQAVHVVSINQATITMDQTPQGTPDTIRMADLEKSDNVIRFHPDPQRLTTDNNPVYLTPGQILSLSPPVTPPERVIVESVSSELRTLPDGSLTTTYRVTLRGPVNNHYPIDQLAATSLNFGLTVTQGTQSEAYPFLSLDPVSPRYYGAVVNGHSKLISLAPASPPDPHPPTTTGLPGQQPAPVPLTGGADENLPNLQPFDYQNGLDTLVNTDVEIVAIPDRQDVTVQTALLDHCQGVGTKFGNRFAIMDSQLRPGAPITGPGSVADQIQPLASFYGFAALYYPWVWVPPAPPPPGSPPPAVAAPNLLVPPSGHVAGVFGRIDNSRGVHKAPAGVAASLQGTIGVETVLGDIEHGLLNTTYGVNVIRVFRGGRPTIWGARTTAVVAGNSNWQYVNVRRLFLFLEASISGGIRFALFEPNNISLWGALKRSITAFLTTVWRDGALFGATAKDAFYVRIDDALNPPDQMALGILTIEIGVRPAYPAEFIVVRIGIWDGGSAVTES